MDFHLTETQEMIRKTARELADREFAPRAAHIDETEEFPWENFKLLRENGFMGICLPEEYGGAGCDNVCVVVAMEEFSRSCLSTSGSWGAHILGYIPLMLAGNEAQKRRYFPLLSTGEMLSALGLTEPTAGSDVANMKTTARRDGDSYVLNGQKIFCTNGSVASYYTIFAKTDPGATPPHRGISAFIVEKGTLGFSFGKLEHKMGIRGSATAELLFNECRIPKENLIGAEGFGFKLAMLTLDNTRPGIGAQGVGIAQGAFDEAMKFAQNRVTFGQRLVEHQAIAFMFADMATEIDAARLLVYRAARTQDEEDWERLVVDGSMAKVFSSEMANRVVNKALQIHGGYGYLKDFPIERMYRDQRITEIYEGTSEIQRLTIARILIGEWTKAHAGV